jgi:hypothetical protein
MESVELLFVTSMLIWTVAAQVALWRLTRRVEAAPALQAVPALGRRGPARRSA